MTEAPTKEGQNVIIKNLNNIFVAVVIASVGWLFTWGNTLSHNQSDQKDQYDQIIAELRGEIKELHNELDDAEKDIIDLQTKTESEHDDTKIRLTKIEDWIQFYSPTKK
jgi:peptidoglycan hydrolase CwlO-like protein